MPVSKYFDLPSVMILFFLVQAIADFSSKISTYDFKRMAINSRRPLGVVYLYDYDGSAYTRRVGPPLNLGELAGDGDQFGSHVSFDQLPTTEFLAVSSPGRDESGQDAGFVFVLDVQNGFDIQGGYGDTSGSGSDSANQNMGNAILSGNGRTLVATSVLYNYAQSAGTF
jgi:hypothetical protein